MTVPVADARRADSMHVIARVGAERFAFRVADVEEVVDAPALVSTPNAPDGLAGQLPYRDRTLRAYDAAWAFDVARLKHATTALVLRVDDDRVALLVDDVEELTSLDADALRPAPPGTDPEGLLRGVCVPRAGHTGHAASTGALIAVVNAAAIVARASAGGAQVQPAPRGNDDHAAAEVRA